MFLQVLDGISALLISELDVRVRGFDFGFGCLVGVEWDQP